ncbi:ATP F0F1 synthase subunit B [Jannaschia sp. Os4]|uniref:F0F1 ATP synthase subunit B n=1 Tax=Jannaschia sp. Os4 TaxID=2807617 RepID=UPI0019396F84|nr:F0F1 ATP synthase subunit B [Jannaschia sp. Os4]MBM2575082.1 ATP F0F1 synthase subunit B [Jannaschia sp. Os4]
MIRLALPLLLLATPALAASGPFFSLKNTDFVVTIGFLLFVGIIFYLKVPPKLSAMLDDRAAGIRRDLDEARTIREDAQKVLADYERKTRAAQDQADEIVANARREAEAASQQARADLDRQVERRLSAAEDQIGSAQDAAVREVRDRAIQVATSVAAQVVAAQMGAQQANKLIDDSIEVVRQKMH